MMEDLIRILDSGNHSLVVENGELLVFDGRGVADIYRLYSEYPAFLNGGRVADKVIGKGAAALMVAGKVKEVYARVISRHAFDLFTGAGIPLTYGTLVDNIINRRGDGICPVESLCKDCATAEECLPLIAEFVNTLKNK